MRFQSIRCGSPENLLPNSWRAFQRPPLLDVHQRHVLDPTSGQKVQKLNDLGLGQVSRDMQLDYRRQPLPDDRRKIEYRLTEKGAELLPAMIALRQWGEKWETGVASSPVLVDEQDQQPISKVELRSHDGRSLGLKDLRWKHIRDIKPLGVPRLQIVS